MLQSSKVMMVKDRDGRPVRRAGAGDQNVIPRYRTVHDSSWTRGLMHREDCEVSSPGVMHREVSCSGKPCTVKVSWPGESCTVKVSWPGKSCTVKVSWPGKPCTVKVSWPGKSCTVKVSWHGESCTVRYPGPGSHAQ